MVRAKSGKGEALSKRNATHAPHMKRLRRYTESPTDDLGPEGVNEGAVSMSIGNHAFKLHELLNAGKGKLFVEDNTFGLSTHDMPKLGERIRKRINELGLNQKELATACGFSQARLGNYLAEQGKKNHRTPGPDDLVKLAKALRWTTDQLLGVSEAPSIEVRAVILRLLELDGMPQARAEVIATVAEAALRLLSSLPAEGDARTRALLAAQAAWQTKPPSKPS